VEDPAEVPLYIASDVHLRPDRPERGRRLAGWVRGLDEGASVLILGDLCDFWMGTRFSEAEILACEGVRALAGYRERGGTLSVMAGNHDRWLCPLYERGLGAEIVAEPLALDAYGLRLHLVHGHLLGARRQWKAWMESRPFFTAFANIPSPVAGLLDRTLENKNQADLKRDEGRHLAAYRQYADGKRGEADIVVIGHVHQAVDDHASDPRLIVLGGWQHRSSYLKIERSGAFLHVVEDEDAEPATTTAALEPIPTLPRPPTS
jgi:UDP-2,3-diacylglucosamine hydrolase